MLGIELEHVAGRRATEVLVDLGDHGTHPDLVVVVGGREPGDVFALVGAGDVDRDMVAVFGGPLDGNELGVLLTHPIDLLVDLLVARSGARDLDPKSVVAGDLDGRTDLDDGIEGDGTRVLSCGDLDLRRRDDIDVVGDNGLGVVVGQRLAQRLLTADAMTELGLEQLARGLSGTEARHADLLGDALESRVDGRVELGLVDLDRELDLVVVKKLDRAGDVAGTHCAKA
ncbi:MAG: hypothetical protein R2707_02410 [Acidimicrobiales bacterium]